MDDINCKDNPVSPCPHCSGHGFIPNLDCSGRECPCHYGLEDYKNTTLYIIREALKRRSSSG
jgi:hypothetical protein